jgi:hypothetical protein
MFTSVEPKWIDDLVSIIIILANDESNVGEE